MWDRFFLERLRRELPRWSKQGWIKPEHERAILKDAAERFKSHNRAPVALALLGAILFSAGVITFFAANWDAIPKLGKLTCKTRDLI
jgi:uncharacterized membrane protein